MVIIRSILAVCLGIIIFGGAYPLFLAGIGRLFFPFATEGSFLKVEGKKVGSELIAQSFTEKAFLIPRPSAAGPDGYDAANSSGSNLPFASSELSALLEQRSNAYRLFNEVPADQSIPVDAVTTSASGLDPDISLDNALLQARRIASTRGVSEKQIRAIIRDQSVTSIFDRLGQRKVNVLNCNLAIDRFETYVKFSGENLHPLQLLEEGEDR